MNFYKINNAFYLVDLPGFGYAKVDPETRFKMEVLLHNYVKDAPELRGVLYLVDPRVTDSPVDHGALEWLLDSDRPVLVLAAKADKLKKEPLRRALADLARLHGLPAPPLAVSAHDRAGMDALWSQLTLLLAPS